MACKDIFIVLAIDSVFDTCACMPCCRKATVDVDVKYYTAPMTTVDVNKPSSDPNIRKTAISHMFCTFTTNHHRTHELTFSSRKITKNG